MLRIYSEETTKKRVLTSTTFDFILNGFRKKSSNRKMGRKWGWVDEDIRSVEEEEIINSLMLIFSLK